MIVWTPISEMPDELRDGRDVLVWRKTKDTAYATRVRWAGGHWQASFYTEWTDADLSHYSEINEPEGVANVPNCSR